MELALSLGNRGVESKSAPFCMGSSSSARSTAEKLLEDDSNNNNNKEKDNTTTCMKDVDDDDDVDDQRRDDVASSSSSDPSPSPLQLDLLPFSPVPRPTQPPPPLRFPWLTDNLSSEPGSSDGPGSKARRTAVGPTAEEAEEQSSPNSGTSSFMEFSLYTSTNNGRGGGGKGKREYNEVIISNNDNGVNNNNGQDIMGLIGGGDQGERGTTTSRGSDDEENGSTRKKLRLSKEQSAFLEESFKEHHTLNPKQKLALAKQLNLRPRQVEVWFQNRRARTKLKQTEVDCEYLKRCCETLTEENRRLQKELQELRALKTSQPFFMQLPATTLTMCPSCERVAPTSTSTSSANAALAPATPTASVVVKPSATAVTVAANGTAVASGSTHHNNNNNEVTLSLGKPKAMLPFSQATS